eukprot:GCRY01002118.1.p1 GENE.GCRY01002118.1~~GCRY01002118.1.p1  ORF type:complete len:338 (-),score=66.53 GCRY01002118.1:220-1233(-)
MTESVNGNVVRKSAKFICERSVDVSVFDEGAEITANHLATLLSNGDYGPDNWRLTPQHPVVVDESTLHWILIVDTLNFSFWNDDPSHPYSVSFEGENYTGYYSLCAAINRGIKEGYPLLSAAYLKDISEADLRHIFRSATKTEIPLFEERLKGLRETGQVLATHFSGNFLNCVQLAEKDALKLRDLIVRFFPSFRDEFSFEGEKVSILKRAQILVADIWAAFQNQGPGQFDNIQEITMFADYRVPQAMVFMGILKYSDRLLRLLENGTPLPSGSREELEIRGCSVWGVELVLEKLKQKGLAPSQRVNAVLVDFFLWDYAKQHNLSHIPIHHTRSIFY